MSKSTYSRRGEVRSSDYYARYHVTGHGKGYRVEVTVGTGVPLSTAYLPKPDKGDTVERAARRYAHESLLRAFEGAREEWLYVRVDGLPGYAHDEPVTAPPGSVLAAYFMTRDGGTRRPVTVYRVFTEDDGLLAAWVEAVQGRDYSEYQNGEFGLSEVTLTRDVMAATDNGRGAAEGVTWLAQSFAADDDE